MCCVNTHVVSNNFCLLQDSNFICHKLCTYVYVAEEFSVVQKEVSDLLQGRVLVGHALCNDLKVCIFYSMSSKYMHVRIIVSGTYLPTVLTVPTVQYPSTHRVCHKFNTLVW